MALDIIKEQRMIRTLYFALSQAADQFVSNDEKEQSFVRSVQQFIQERVISSDSLRDKEEVVREQIETLGWRNIQLNYQEDSGEGKLLLGRNRYIVKDKAETPGTFLLIRSLIQGLCQELFNVPVNTNVQLSLRSGSFYEITFEKTTLWVPSKKTEHGREEPGSKIEKGVIPPLTIENIFHPILARKVPELILFEAAWKVITESFLANYTEEKGTEISNALNEQTIENLSFLIPKLVENEEPEEILNLSELLGEFVAKILKQRIDESIIELLQPTLQDRHANSYLIYYEQRSFCADKQVENRCHFIHGLWVGILSEVYSMPMKINEVYHAGKRDKYCMVELIPKSS
jgi:predicted hydrocarbon binding protein